MHLFSIITHLQESRQARSYLAMKGSGRALHIFKKRNATTFSFKPRFFAKRDHTRNG